MRSPPNISFAQIPRFVTQGATVIISIDIADIGNACGNACDGACGNARAGACDGACGNACADACGNSCVWDFSLLSADERRCMSQFHTAHLACIYGRQRILLRTLLAYCISRSTADISYYYNAYGKPFLQCNNTPHKSRKAARLALQKPFPQCNNTPHTCYFSLAHTKSVMLIALSTRGDIGIDCEEYRRALSWTQIREFLGVKKHMNPSECTHYWTQLEASAKYMGVSLYNHSSIPPLRDGNTHRIKYFMARHAARVRLYHTVSLRLSSAYATACAVSGWKRRPMVYCSIKIDDVISNAPA